MLVWVGGALLAVGAVLVVVGVVLSLRSVPFGIITAGGAPGDDVVAVVAAPSAGVVELEADREVSFLLVAPHGARPERLESRVTVTGPDGAPVEVVPGTAAGFSISGGDRSGRVVGAVVPEHTGRHTVVVPDASPHGSEVFLAYVPATSSFALGLFGGVGGIVLGSLAGTAGLFLLVGGLVWGAVRKDPPPRAG